MVGQTMSRPGWINCRKKSRFPWFTRSWKEKPTLGLKLFDEKAKHSTETPASLLEEAWHSCKLVKAMYADLKLAEYYEQDKRLEIIRLSGDPLSLNECYINLLIIESRGARTEEKTSSSQGSEFFMITRLKVEAPSAEKAVDLTKLFDDRKTNNGIFRPRRILVSWPCRCRQNNVVQKDCSRLRLQGHVG